MFLFFHFFTKSKLTFLKLQTRHGLISLFSYTTIWLMHDVCSKKHVCHLLKNANTLNCDGQKDEWAGDGAVKPTGQLTKTEDRKWFIKKIVVHTVHTQSCAYLYTYTLIAMYISHKCKSKQGQCHSHGSCLFVFFTFLFNVTTCSL